MYRVELKVENVAKKVKPDKVPNVPCGVERNLGPLGAKPPACVPNVPCGVERKAKHNKHFFAICS